MSQATLTPPTATAPTAAPVNPNKALWEKGDFTRIARTMRESGDALVRGLDVQPGMQVLDLGCGDGTTAVPAAQLGAQVLGVDISSPLVQAGNRRVQALGLSNLHFQEGDACDLQGIGDQRFDLLVSIFGAMFAPKPFDVAKEAVRVVRSGGRIVMGNWIPNDPTLVAQILKICSAYSPPPPAGFISPMTWGVEANVIERFVAAGVPESNIAFERCTYTFGGDLSPAEFLSEFRHYYGPTMNAFAAAEQQGKAEGLQGELGALFERENRNPNKGAITIPATFLKVTVTCP
ncbi:MAG: methyltransferase domain-containing protein [Hydrogenophaga sp.]|uniref:class I SAM-dependent methyltransferase n=1 Tax=Hydrogenophaga sp. TaxID=1904254 RepID=UPI001DAE90ED|nr:class I SAM-dependent methyltransferase [Hydrogenophaga sp.]MBX3608702.1 methyltransferase domain-containing protein [Hydrogenophaga sp.]